LGRGDFEEAVETLFDAFRDYPVMRFVVGDAGDEYDGRVRDLIGYFTDSRLLRDWPGLGVLDDAELAAVANLNPPESAPAPPELERRYRRLEERLGKDAIRRFELFGRSEEPFTPDAPHHYLGMIGVRRDRQGQGVGRLLLEWIHELSRTHPDSTGVRLTTELPANVKFYERLGYRVSGHVRLDGLDSWSLFRENP
jgi:GNAT superfamily N-acetyltransferase